MRFPDSVELLTKMTQTKTVVLFTVQCDNQRMAAGLQRRNSRQSQSTNFLVDAATSLKNRSRALLVGTAYRSRCEAPHGTTTDTIRTNQDRTYCKVAWSCVTELLTDSLDPTTGPKQPGRPRRTQTQP